MVSYLLSDTSLSQAVSYTWLTLMPGYNAFSCDLLVLSRRGVAQLYTGISAGGGYAQFCCCGIVDTHDLMGVPFK